MTEWTRGDPDTMANDRSSFSLRSMRYASSLGALLLGAMLSLAWVAPASAQSAADKATARQLATEGIKLYTDGKYADALDRLQRAESLYDAPVHLIYIARSQVKLGQLVEATETYRRLIRTELADNAPKAFHQAVEDGKTELAPLEGQIPAVRIKISPDNVAGLEVTLDADKVPVAALGVDRPANPGEHKVHASAPGYQPADASVTLNPSEHKEVSLTLTPGAGGPPPPAGQPDTGGGAGGHWGGPAGGGSGGRESGPSNNGIGFIAGARLGLAAPTGTASSDEVLAANSSGVDLPMSDFFGAGAGLELHAGVRFLGRFSGYVLYERDFFQAGRRLDDVSHYMDAVSVTSQTGGDNFGLGGSYDFMTGPFRLTGELAVLPVHKYDATQSVVPNTTASGCAAHKNTLAFSGTAGRLGLVSSVQLSRTVALTPTLELTFGQFSHFEATTECKTTADNPFPFVGANETKASKDLGAPKTHTTVFLGVGVDFYFGGSNPAK